MEVKMRETTRHQGSLQGYVFTKERHAVMLFIGNMTLNPSELDRGRVKFTTLPYLLTANL